MWFHDIALPYFKKKEGEKVLIGDNLISHINSSVIDSCKKHGIDFACLPPNSTCLTHSLDV